MEPVRLRKSRAGSDSYGHTWPEDGSTVEVDYDQAMVLLAIPDGGFTVDDRPGDDPGFESEGAEPDLSGDATVDSDTGETTDGSDADPESIDPGAPDDLSEVAPQSDDATDKTAPAKKATARRTTKS